MPDSFCHDVIYFFQRKGYNKKKGRGQMGVWSRLQIISCWWIRQCLQES